MSIFIFNTSFNLQGYKSKRKMPIFTPDTYWKDCFSHVARFLQQLVNIQSYDLEWKNKKKKKSAETRSNKKLIIQFNATNILDSCWYKTNQLKSHELFVWTTNNNCCRTRKQEKNTHTKTLFKKPFSPGKSVCVYVCAVKCWGCQCQERKSPVQAKGWCKLCLSLKPRR